MRLRRYSSGLLMLLSLLLVSCDSGGGQQNGLRDISPTQLVVHTRTLKMANAIRNYWPAPDGSKMLVLDENMGLSMVDMAKGDAISPLSLPLPASHSLSAVAWSPDSSAFAYTSVSDNPAQPDGISAIYSVSTSVSISLPQASDVSDTASAVWNSKGDRLYFLGYRNGRQQVMSAGRDGKTPTTLFATATQPGERADFISPTPDGSHFIYNLRDSAASIPKGGIYEANADGSGLKLLYDEPSVAALHISPAGDSVLVEQQRGTYVITATFSSILWFSPTRAGDRKILLPFPKAMTNTPPEILSGATTSGAAWSPDGDKIIYITHNYAATAEAPRSIWVVAADGSDPAEVYTSTQETDLTLPNNQTLVWASNNAVVTANMGDTFTIIQLDKKQ